MGKRGKGSPTKVEKPDDNVKGKRELTPEQNPPNTKSCIVVKRSIPTPDCGPAKDFKITSTVKISIDYKCWRRAEDAFSKTGTGRKITKEKTISTNKPVSPVDECENKAIKSKKNTNLDKQGSYHTPSNTPLKTRTFSKKSPVKKRIIFPTKEKRSVNHLKKAAIPPTNTESTTCIEKNSFSPKESESTSHTRNKPVNCDKSKAASRLRKKATTSKKPKASIQIQKKSFSPSEDPEYKINLRKKFSASKELISTHCLRKKPVSCKESVATTRCPNKYTRSASSTKSRETPCIRTTRGSANNNPAQIAAGPSLRRRGDFNRIQQSELDRTEKSTKVSNTKKSANSTARARHRRRALTQALQRLRRSSRKPKKSRSVRKAIPPSNRSLRKRKPLSVSVEETKIEDVQSHQSETEKISSKMNNDMNSMDEESGTPSFASNNISPSPESDDQTDPIVEDFESDSEFEMQVLEKQVESEKEEDDDATRTEDVSLTLPDDTDEESSLLSPSALPASQLFRSPSSRKKKRKSLSDASSLERCHQQDIPSSIRSSTPLVPSYRSFSPEIPNSPLFPTTSLIDSSSFIGGPLGTLPGKRGRGRPRKTMEEMNSLGMKSYRKKMTEQLASVGDQNLFHYETHLSQQEPVPFPSSDMVLDEFVMDSAVEQPVNDIYAGEGVETADPENFHERLQRWKDRSTFVYARHKFVSNENKFKCDTCQVSFTALSSLKRHYGTIYHKQQEAAGRPTLDLTDILRPDRNGNTAGPTPGPSSSSTYHTSGRGRGRGRPSFSRTTSFVRRSAVDNIKKYYAAADAARRRRENSTVSASTSNPRGTGTYSSTWLHKQQRKRKPLLHADYLYSSASPFSEVDEEEDDDFGCENEENNENSSPENDIGESYNVNGTTDVTADSTVQTPWLSNVWKGKGPPHFTCEYCNQSFTKKFEFTSHLFQHRQDEAEQMTLTCPECAVSFATTQMLEHHFDLFNHGIGVVRQGWPVKKLTCEKCNSKFSRRDYYLKHVEVHRRALLKCPHCPKKFLYKFYLYDHVKAKHFGWPNNIANGTANGIAMSQVSGGIPTGNSVNSNNTTSTTLTYIPKPKIELYSSTTSLFPPTECIIKRKQPNTITPNSSGSETHQLDADNNGISSWRKKLLPSSGELKTPDIVVPSFNICDDPFGEKEALIKDPGSVYEFQDYDDFPETIEMHSSLTTSSSTDQSNKGQVNLLQKFFDSQTDEAPHDPEDTLKNKVNINLVSATNELPGIDRSTTEDGKIVFQLEHSMFKGFSTMEVGLGDEDACSLSPLTIEIPRDKINIGVEDDKANEIVEQLEKSAVEDAQVNIEKVISFPPSPASVSRTGDAEKAESIHSANSNSNSSMFTAMSAPQLLGCGAKNLNLNPPPENNELQCQDCGKIFEHRKSLIKHVRYYNQVESYSCTLCDKSFKLKHHVSRHIKSFHNIETNSTTSSASDDALLEDQGEMEFLSSMAVTVTPAATVKNVTGTEVGSEVQSSSAVREIAVGPRKEPIVASTSASAMKRSFSTEKSIVPTDRKKFTVSDPSRRRGDSDTQSLFSKSNYETVIDSSGATVFKCLICKKLYPSKHQISSHLSYHKRTIPFKCIECEAGFKFKSDLDAHMEVHINPKEKISNGYVCEKCPDSIQFPESKDLLKHLREKHHYLGRKPLISEDHKGQSQPAIRRCPLCPLVFPQESGLQLHMSLEHNQNDEFVCRTCGEILLSAESLKEHMVTDHQGNNPIYDEFGLGEQNEEEHLPMPSAHSPFNTLELPVEPEDDELPEGETNPSSPEFELLELN